MSELQADDKAARALRNVAARWAARELARAELRMEEAKRREIEAGLRQAQGKYDAVEASERETAGVWLANDLPAPRGQHAKRRKKLAAAEDEIATHEAALPVVDRKIAAARARLAETEPPLIADALALKGSLHEPAFERVREILAELAGPLATLIATDIAIGEVTGERFTIPPGARVPPFGGVAALKLLEALPSRLRPEGLTAETLTAKARKIASSVLSDIKGKSQ